MKRVRGSAGKKAPARARGKKTGRKVASARIKRDRSDSKVQTASAPVNFLSAADSLFRCAVESCRQHHRVARLIAGGAEEAEQRIAWKVAVMCDSLLKQVTDTYATMASRTASNISEQLRSCGNALWRASRAFTNRFLDEGYISGNSTREHSSGDFLDLRLRHELDASSILSLKQAAEEYRRVRPEAGLSIGEGRWE